ncbi:hybrid sensor histidine kinase/response regulator [Flavobacterium magnum]|uniref:histidine kinase n=1 Tax=Flavobacterium magnum TaxID=2162713 RepID=A0A2S0RFX5_9FLAO|nr:response regulator [Flavobacterium magnum]AWA30200.1 hybrid sensor histidine kinase/response regulator [Flavobacterium magnum]
MILIVDDKRENIIPLKKILELHHLESDSAESGEEALKMILKKNYSLIILDVQMPGMDGFEVAEALSGSNRTKDIPIIFLSAINKEKKYISKGYQTGGVDYVTKPVDADLLILKVKTFLKLYQQQQELKALHGLLSKEIEIRKEAQENLEGKVLERTRELQSKNEELEFRNHELQQFAWVVSHDLKEPIRKIEIFVRLIKERYLIDEQKAHETVDRALASSARMTKLIEDLLDYSRLSSSAVPEQTDLNEVVGEVLSDLEYLIDQKNGTVILANDLPVIMGIQSQLRQVMQNLIGNSLKFSKPDIAPVITITSECVTEKDCDATDCEKGKYYRISVKDNGIGFDQNYVDKIFTIFQRLHHRDAYEGTGIGLAIAKKIIEKHNGLITARSQEGQGAEFIIILPK